MRTSLNQSLFLIWATLREQKQKISKKCFSNVESMLQFLKKVGVHLKLGL